MIANDLASNPEFPSQVNNRRLATFDAQLFTLKNSVIQLRNAYNGHDVEWADVGMYHWHIFFSYIAISLELNEKLICNFFFFWTEEPYYGSGSGSGGGSIEENGEGSGLGDINYTPSIIEQGPSTIHPVDPISGGGSSGTGIILDKSDNEVNKSVDKSESNNNNIDSNSINDKRQHSGSSAVGTNSQMSLKRALFTYFLPIYLAWFGGLFSELLWSTYNFFLTILINYTNLI